MKKVIIGLLVLISSGYSWGQERPSAWEIEADPIAYLLNGYSIHGIYQIKRIRLDAGVYGIQVPEGFQSNKGYKLRNEGFGLKAQYLFNGINGFYAGVDAGYGKLRANLQETNEQASGTSISTGVNVGYKLFLQKDKQGNPNGFYLNPWMGLSYNFYPNEVKFANRNYKNDHLGFFPTVHVGYRF
ncbi:MAG TPA: hypothetical protein VEV16_07480 [Daejeonella sp.]|nr:hypothetical protein [Daejeonella sp.]